MPRDMTADRYSNFIEQGLAAVRALEVGNAMTHLEGFLLEGGRVCFTDATLRPAGGASGRCWRLRTTSTLTASGRGSRWTVVLTARGSENTPSARCSCGASVGDRCSVWRALKRSGGGWAIGWLTAACRGSAVRSLETYTGDGYITVRHTETETVEAYLDFIANTVLDHLQSRRRSAGWRRGRAAAVVAAAVGFQSAALPGRLGMMIRCRASANA